MNKPRMVSEEYYEAVLFQGKRIVSRCSRDPRVAVRDALRGYYDPKSTGVGGSFPTRMAKMSTKTALELVSIRSDGGEEAPVPDGFDLDDSDVHVLVLVGEPSGYLHRKWQEVPSRLDEDRESRVRSRIAARR